MNTTIPEIKEANLEPVEVLRQKEVPEVIELTISEVDRQTAGQYFDPTNNCVNCLIGTALRNRGCNVRIVGVDQVYLDDGEYRFDQRMTASDLYNEPFAEVVPFYSHEVVGKVIRMRKVA